MKKTLTVPVILTALIMAGCSSAPVKFNEKKSKAYNVAQAGGLYSDVKDTKVPANQLSNLTGVVVGAGDTFAGYLKPQFGMTNWQTAGLNLVGASFKPDSHGSRSSLLAWMPEGEASSVSAAREIMADNVTLAVIEGAKSFGAIGKLERKAPKVDIVVYSIVNPEWGCEWEVKDQTCFVVARVVKPVKGVAPAFIAGHERPSYIFSGNHKYNYSKIYLRLDKNPRVPEDELMAAISKNLPSWVHLYNAPKTITPLDGEKISYPYMLNKGEPEFFVIPE